MTRYLLPCHEGLEAIVAQDALALGAREATQLVGRVLVEGESDLLYALNLAHPAASKVHQVLAEAEVTTPEQVARAARDLDWARIFDPTLSFAVDALRVGDHAWTSQDVERAVGAAVKEATGARVDLRRPDVKVHVEVRDARAWIAVDTTGAPLHERPWRAYATRAPLNACLASAMVAWSEWPERGGVLLDPTTGSGTIAIEADFRARRRAPNLARRAWAFERLRLHDAEALERARDALACAALDEGPPILANDRNPEHVAGAKENARRAGAPIGLSVADFNDLARPDGLSTVISNPPWGLRMETRAAAARIGGALREKLVEWAPATAVVLVGGRGFEQHEPRPSEARGLVYGGAYCRMLKYRFSDRTGSG